MINNIISEEATTVASSINNNAIYSPIVIDPDGESFSITNNGTAPAPCRITIVPKNDIMLLTIEGLSEEPIQFTKIKKGQMLVLDGIDRKITLDGKNAFNNFFGWEFPKIFVGVNKIKMTSAAQSDISIEYQPRYI